MIEGVYGVQEEQFDADLHSKRILDLGGEDVLIALDMEQSCEFG